MPKNKSVKYKASDITQRLVVERLRVYNRRVNQLKKKGGAYELLENKTVKDIVSGKTDGEIARELNQLEKLGQKEQQKLVKYSKKSETEVPKFVREQIERELKKANKLSQKMREKLKPSKDAGTLSTLESENLKPLTKGSGASLKAIKARRESIRNRGKESYYSDAIKRYKANYIKALREELGAYADKVIRKIEQIDPYRLYDAMSDPEYGGDLQISYIYGAQAAAEKAETILNAIDKLGLV